MGGCTTEYNRFTPKYQKCFFIAAYDILVDNGLFDEIDKKANELLKTSNKELKNIYGL